MNVRPREERTLAGVLLMGLAVVFFTGIDTSAKWLSIAGFPVFQIVLVRYLGHLIISTALYLPQEGPGAFRSNAPARQLMRSTVLFLGTVCNFAALKYLPITLTITISFAGPILITLLAIPLLGETVGLRRIIAVCVGFIGVAIVVQPWGTAFHPAIFFSLATLVFASMYFITTRMLAGIESVSTQQIWASGVATIALLPFAIPVWVWPETATAWFVLCMIGLFGALGHISTTIAHRWADASTLAPMIYTQIFWVTLSGVIFFNTWPTVWTLAGGAVIVASGVYIWQRERLATSD